AAPPAAAKPAPPTGKAAARPGSAANLPGSAALPDRTARAAAPAEVRGGGRIFASPLARRLAKELGVDVASLNGSGPRGRVIRRDVEAALQAAGARPRAGTAVAP